MTPNLDALAKLAPFLHCLEVGVHGECTSVVRASDGQLVADDSTFSADIAAALNEWAELRAYRERTAWQPIGTAPKDGTEILALCRAPARDGVYYEAVRYLTDAPCWVTSEGWMRHPTHWMPMPAGPGQGATDGN